MAFTLNSNHNPVWRSSLRSQRITRRPKSVVILAGDIQKSGYMSVFFSSYSSVIQQLMVDRVNLFDCRLVLMAWNMSSLSQRTDSWLIVTLNQYYVLNMVYYVWRTPSRRHLMILRWNRKLKRYLVGDVVYPSIFPCLVIYELPAFYFNFKDSILGTIIVNEQAGNGHLHLPFRHFIATPLLPCGKFDVPIKKFTGNDSIGDAEDDMTTAIHAFAHFSVVYSSQELVFCDLQGMLTHFWLSVMSESLTLEN